MRSMNGGLRRVSVADATSPDFIIRQTRVATQPLQGRICAFGGDLGRAAAEDATRPICVRGRRARPLASFGRECRSLREVGSVRSGQHAKQRQFALLDPARVGRRQSHAAPQISVSIDGKLRDNRRDTLDIRTLYEPQASPQPLIERAQRIAREPARPQSCPQGDAGMEIALVEAVAIECQPAEQRIEAARQMTLAAAEARERPARAHVHHVGVIPARPREQLREASAAPWREQIEKCVGHGGALVSEASIDRGDGAEPALESC